MKHKKDSDNDALKEKEEDQIKDLKDYNYYKSRSFHYIIPGNRKVHR